MLSPIYRCGNCHAEYHSELLSHTDGPAESLWGLSDHHVRCVNHFFFFIFEKKHNICNFPFLFDPFAYGFGNRICLHPWRLFWSSSERLEFSFKFLFLSLDLNIFGQFHDLIMRNESGALISVEGKPLIPSGD